MPTFRYAKLVRDNIRDMHEANGDKVLGSILPKQEHILALVEKLKEEADELTAAIQSGNTLDIVAELADVEQVLEDVQLLLDANKEAIQRLKKEKFQKKGGFLRGEYIDTVTIVNKNDPLVERFRAEPDKFLETPD